MQQCICVAAYLLVVAWFPSGIPNLNLFGVRRNKIMQILSTLRIYEIGTTRIISSKTFIISKHKNEENKYFLVTFSHTSFFSTQNL